MKSFRKWTALAACSLTILCGSPAWPDSTAAYATAGSPGLPSNTARVSGRTAAQSNLSFTYREYYASAGGGPALLTVRRLSAPVGAMSVSYASSDDSAKAGKAYTAVSGTLNWADGDSSPKSISVPITIAATPAKDEYFTVALSSPVGGALSGPSSAKVSIVGQDGQASGAGPIMFVTQVPTAGYLAVTSAFGNHRTTEMQVPRGGDLYIRYTDGTLRNLTQEAGFGMTGRQGANAIAVRQPTVHWSGRRALFSMLIGAPTQQFDEPTTFWQIYEVTGFMPGETVQITKVAQQPANFNNIAPIYGSDDSIIFSSDQPRNSDAHLYPQLDEYESEPTETGLWKIDSLSKSLRLLEHAPSGLFYPSVDSFGRLIFTKWDHLVRDQQADADQFGTDPGEAFGSFNYSSETSYTPPATFTRAEFYPELLHAIYSSSNGQTVAPGYPYNDFDFNHFFPWMLNQDGTGEETLNHVGRHELGGSYTVGNLSADTSLQGFNPGQFNGATYFTRGSAGIQHLREDPTHPGLFYCVDAPEFATATGGDLVSLQGAPSDNPEDMALHLLASAASLGQFRNPLPLSDGTLIAVHTPDTGDLANSGTEASPLINYAFRMDHVTISNGQATVGAPLTSGIQKTLSYYDPDVLVTWSGALWELDPVEVRTQAAPPMTVAAAVPAPEQQIFDSAGVDPQLLMNWMSGKHLALIVSRNVTTRDRADEQQPFNLQAAGGVVTAPTAGATIYNVERMQIVEADQLRGYTSNGLVPQSGGTPSPGRRVLGEPLNDANAIAWNEKVPPAAAPGSYPLGTDGSMAVFVPAQRAMSWQMIDQNALGIVRERNWLSFQPGEIRSCPACHGINKFDQVDQTVPTNPPQALATLLSNWTGKLRKQCPATGGTGTWSYSGVNYTACGEGQQYRIQTCQGGNGCCDGLPQTEGLCP